MVRLIPQPYKIVNKESTRVLRKTIEECRLIYNCWSILSPTLQFKLNKQFNDEIHHKLNKCYKFYQKNYNVTIENGYGLANDIEINISNICETIKSWEL